MFKQIKQSMEKNFENKLDRYCALKSTKLLYGILRWCNITIKYTKQHNCYLVQIKKPKEEAKYYKEFERIYFNESLETYLYYLKADRNEIRKKALKMLEE